MEVPPTFRRPYFELDDGRNHHPHSPIPVAFLAPERISESYVRSELERVLCGIYHTRCYRK